MSRSRSKPTRPASRRRAFAAIARPASTASRSACRRSTIASLKELGRLHTAQEALDAVAIARKSFDRYSFDLIYARPRQTPQQWEAELKRAIARSGRASVALSTDHRAGNAVPRAAQGRQARHSRRRHRPRALRPDAGDLRQRRPAGLRGLQPRPAGRRVPAQPGLLARPRIRRRRPGRPRPARHRRPPPRHHDREAPRGLADAGRIARPRPDHRRPADVARSAPTNSC